MGRKRKNPGAGMKLDVSSMITDSIIFMVFARHIKPAIEEMRKEIQAMSLRGCEDDHGDYETELMIAVEYGFVANERGWNLEKTTDEFQKIMKGGNCG